jgi:hypothetical protein
MPTDKIRALLTDNQVNNQKILYEYLDALKAEIDDLVANPVSGAEPYEVQIVAGSAVQDIDFTEIDRVAIDGETDGGYEIEGAIIPAAASFFVTLQPNSLTTNQDGIRCEILASAIADGVTQARTDLLLGVANSGIPRAYFKAEFTPSKGITGIPRILTSRYWWVTSERRMCFTQCEWAVTTAITTLRIHASSAGGFGVGSIFSVRRRSHPGF